MECFNCLGEIFIAPYSYTLKPKMCFCSRSCVQVYRAIAIEHHIERVQDALKTDEYTSTTIRSFQIEVVFLRAVLRRSKKAQLIKLKQMLMESYVDVLERKASADTPQQEYLDLAETTKINLNKFDEYIECFSS